MKKIILLLTLLFLIPFLSFSQTDDIKVNGKEGFENGIPADWTVHTNGVGLQKWGVTGFLPNVHSGNFAAEVLRENIGKDNTEEDWLITPKLTITPQRQLRFFSRSQLPADDLTRYQIRVSSTTATGPTDVDSYTVVAEFTELELSADSFTYEEKIISLGTLTGSRYIAFVRVFTQPTDQIGGDRWLLDDISIVEQCNDPSNLNAGSITAKSAIFTWAGTAATYEIEYGVSGFTPGSGTLVKGVVGNSYTPTDLPPDTLCDFWVRGVCASGVNSNQIGPFIFHTLPLGTICAEPKLISSIPYQVTGDKTANYGNHYNPTAGQGTACGAVPSTTNFFKGNDVFYSYTPASSGVISITMTPIGTASTNSSIFVYDGCANVGVSCVIGMANVYNTPRVLNLNVVANTTYVIAISSSVGTPSITYDLMIQNENCTPKPTSLAANPDFDTADLSWSTDGFSEWEVQVQPFGSLIPSGHGDDVVTSPLPFHKTGLTSATQYQYWVRARCAPNSASYTAWSGPFAFNTLICVPTDKCDHIFRLDDSAQNGWQGATMQVRQNGIVVASFGSTYSSAVPLEVTVPLCKNIPFDLFWSNAGTQPEQCIVSVINKFGQTLYTKKAGVGTAGTVLFTETVNCDTARCDIAPVNLSAVPTAHDAVLSWEAPATTQWDIYVVPKGTPAPGSTTTPTYDNVSQNPYTTTIALDADTDYDFYVRVHCNSSNPSNWSAAGTFHTTVTCPKPIIPATNGVTGITLTSATLNWINGTPTDAKWEILLVPSATTTPPTTLPPVNPTYPNQRLIVVTPADPDYTAAPSYTVNGLTEATIYFYYIRTVCSDTDKSVWATGPIPIVPFNTKICTSGQCNYQFVMTDSGLNNGWQGNAMQVRQNGIVVQNLGFQISGTGPNTATVPLCPGVPFDLYWNAAGTNPNEVGVTIKDTSGDVIYTKAPGQGNPLEILYSSIGNCTPPTCPKPTNPQVVLVEATQARLQWTKGGNETQWEVYVVPAGSASVPPKNDDPVIGEDPWAGGPYYLANTNPFTVTGLASGTAYVYYVRAICSGGTDPGSWSTTPKSFTTLALSDECVAATLVPVNPDKAFVLSAHGSTLGATGSTPLTSPVCKGSTDDDVWFTFVAEASTHIITLNNIVGQTTDLNHTLYEGVTCSSLTQKYCSNPNISVATGLTIGSTYKIRVYTNAPGVYSTFDIFITTPPAIANDECVTAIPATVNDGLECQNMAPGSLTGASASSNASTCFGVEDDDVWFSFKATASTHYFNLKNIIGTTNDLNMGIYSGDCGSLVQKYCSPSNMLEGNTNGFVIGDIYYVRVWSNTDIKQDVTFDLCIGTVLPPIKTSTTKYTPQELIEEVLLDTKCASVTNVTSSTGTNFGSVNGIGYFEKSLSGFPFKDGVILTSGNALNAPGPNAFNLNEGSGLWPGDQDLADIIFEGTGVPMTNPYNASILEFDFVPISDKISFNFLFASEEYGFFQCSYSDAFAFILTNTDTHVKTNLAVVPNTTIPVSVVTIRDELYNADCSSQNPDYFGYYYKPPFGVNALGDPTNYNGITVPLTAKSDVTAGEHYHIKLVIADKGDTWYDSAVFLEGGSFNIGSVDLGADIEGANAVCNGSTTTIHSNLNPAEYTINWIKDGVEIPGEHAPDLVVSSEGDYCIKAQFGASTCFAEDCVFVEFYQEAAPGKPNDLNICSSASSTGIFDLTQNTPLILAPYASDTTKNHTVHYYLSDPTTDPGAIQISDAEAASFTNTVNPQTIYARVDNDFISCTQVTSFVISIKDVSPKFTLSGATSYCPRDSSTITVVPVDNDYDPTKVTYTWTFEGQGIPGGSSLEISGPYGAYSVTVTNLGCFSTQSFTTTNSNSVWDFTFLNTPYEICSNQSVELSFRAENFDIDSPGAFYTWTAPDGVTVTNGKTTMANQIGDYTLEVDIFGCKTTKTVPVSENTDTVAVEITSGCDGKQYKLEANPVGNSFDPATSEFTWTGPDFSPVEGKPNTILVNATGLYTVKVKTADGCSAEESNDVKSISCNIQKGISPNGDQKNDSFILNDAKKMEIFNRYGLKVYSYNDYTNQWHGQTDGGNDLPDGTYYYVVTRGNGDLITGWIYILR